MEANMQLKRVSSHNGEWEKVWQNWDSICDKYSEQFSDYAPAALGTLAPLAESPQVDSAGVYGLTDGNDFAALCQLNVALLPGYTGKVLRMRHLVLSPEFDYSDALTADDYATVLSQVFSGAVALTSNEMRAEHLKLHLSSPADKQFFSTITDYLSEHATFRSVKMQGTWLYITV